MSVLLYQKHKGLKMYDIGKNWMNEVQKTVNLWSLSAFNVHILFCCSRFQSFFFTAKLHLNRNFLYSDFILSFSLKKFFCHCWPTNCTSKNNCLWNLIAASVVAQCLKLHTDLTVCYSCCLVMLSFGSRTKTVVVVSLLTSVDDDFNNVNDSNDNDDDNDDDSDGNDPVWCS